MTDTGLIESRYVDILHIRMEGVAILNHKLRVKALGFRSFEQEQLGVLITPWFMNLMLLAETDNQWSEADAGSKIMRNLPSGPYEFILGWDEVLGGYAMCALFSPMFQFDDQEAAVATAEAVMNALFEVDNFAPTDRQRQRREQALTDKAGEESPEAVETAEHADLVVPVNAEPGIFSLKRSRREFLQGRIRAPDR